MKNGELVAIFFLASLFVGYSNADPQQNELEERSIISKLHCLKCRRIFTQDDYCCQRGERGCCGGFGHHHHGTNVGGGSVISVVVKPGVKETFPGIKYGAVVPRPIAVVPQPIAYVPQPIPVVPQPIAYVPRPIPVMPQPIRFPSQCTCYPHLGVKNGVPVIEKPAPTYPEAGSPVVAGSAGAYIDPVPVTSGSGGGYPVTITASPGGGHLMSSTSSPGGSSGY